jgi:hypothetical protein
VNKAGEGMKKRHWVVLIMSGVFGTALVMDKIWYAEKSSTHDPLRLVHLVLNEEDAREDAALLMGTLEVRFRLDPWHLTNSSARDQFYYKSTEIFERSFKQVPGIERVRINGTLESTDAMGNKDRGDVIRLEMTKATAGEINWKNFKPKNLPIVADRSWNHPALGQDQG